LKEEEEKKVIESKILKLQKGDDKKHNEIKEKITHHAKKCTCAHAKTTEAKTKCIETCKSKKEHLKKIVADHVKETSTSCESKSSVVCGDSNTADSQKCKKSFIVLCNEEQTKRKNELVTLLENCESLDAEPSIVFQH